MRGIVLSTSLATWLWAAGVAAQTEPATPPVMPPGYATSGVSIGQGVPVATPTTVAGPRVEIREREESLRSVWIPGLIGLPLSWLLTWSVASTTASLDGDAIELSYIPLVGPWLMLGQPLNGADGYYISAGIFQAASALALVIGLAVRRTVREQVWVTGLDVGAAPLPGGGLGTLRIAF